MSTYDDDYDYEDEDYYDEEDNSVSTELDGIGDICKRGYFNVRATVTTQVYYGDGDCGCCETEHGSYDVEYHTAFTGNTFECLDYVNRMNGDIYAITLTETPNGDGNDVAIDVRANVIIHDDQLVPLSESIYFPAGTELKKRFDLTDPAFIALLQRAESLMEDDYFKSWATHHRTKRNKTMTTQIKQDDALWFSDLTYDYINSEDDFYTGNVKEMFDRLYSVITKGRNFDHDRAEKLFTTCPFDEDAQKAKQDGDHIVPFYHDRYAEMKFGTDTMSTITGTHFLEVRPCSMFGKLHYQESVAAYWEAIDLVKRFGGQITSVKIGSTPIDYKSKKTRPVLEVEVVGWKSLSGAHDCKFWSNTKPAPKTLTVKGPLLELLERAKQVCPSDYHNRIDQNLACAGHKTTFDERDMQMVRHLMYDRANNPDAYVVEPRAPLPQLYNAATGRNLFADIENSNNDRVFIKAEVV